MTDCRNCGRDTDLFLCRLCEVDLAGLLGELPWLLGQLEITVARQDRLTTGSVGRSSENPSPVNVGAMELARALAGQLGTIVRELCEARAAVVPDLPADALASALWLSVNVTAIACSEGAGETMDEIREARDSMLAAINRSSRMYCGPCLTVVARDPDGSDIECGTDLYADRESLESIVCPRCHVVLDPRRQLLAVVARRDLLPEPLLLEALADIGEPVTPDQLKRWLYRGRLKIRGYLHDGRITEKQVRGTDARVFSLSQARALRTGTE